MASHKPATGLLFTLLMFPQIAETIYSPALTDIAHHFATPERAAAQTLSIYFIAFAMGVGFWGGMADRIGRRPAMLWGLALYSLSAGAALIVDQFETLLFVRALSAFGAAVGSVVTQTMLRDAYSGTDLAKMFAVMGLGMAISPVLGFFAGGLLTAFGGYLSVFAGLFVMSAALLGLSARQLPETRPLTLNAAAFKTLASQLARDGYVLRHMALVALFNLMLFSYYSLAPFIFESLGYSSVEFGYSGVILAIGSLAGSLLNQAGLRRGMTPPQLIRTGTGMAILGGFGVMLTQKTLWFLAPMSLTLMSYSIAIPNILSQALARYRANAGAAGALFGLAYYLLLGIGLVVSGWLQNLGATLLSAATGCLLLCAWAATLQTDLAENSA
ncbi:Permease of the major facilitator superfamily [Hahella chejuensis KCTC 2396]|uniref:Permease of the major facilitator superfamily n=1 Tax=Hahella chejuensis (strain KCTC 2396) TaxID=349521 RepID=Q2SI24_HAHCH|nr:multidrug effflux MFS transporter [Hahella chejuensis]ABC29700.1 Permease of the major facilitator superfamily [Hahella chejuensis KCTC 2396]